jgi:hypothetical protein
MTTTSECSDDVKSNIVDVKFKTKPARMDGCKLQIKGIALREEHTKDSREQTEDKKKPRRSHAPTTTNKQVWCTDKELN